MIIEGDVTPAGIKWRTNPYTGKVVYKKTEAARKALATRIKAIDVDVLALQEVENIEALEAFVRGFLSRKRFDAVGGSFKPQRSVRGSPWRSAGVHGNGR